MYEPAHFIGENRVFLKQHFWIVAMLTGAALGHYAGRNAWPFRRFLLAAVLHAAAVGLTVLLLWLLFPDS